MNPVIFYRSPYPSQPNLLLPLDYLSAHPTHRQRKDLKPEHSSCSPACIFQWPPDITSLGGSCLRVQPPLICMFSEISRTKPRALSPPHPYSRWSRVAWKALSTPAFYLENASLSSKPPRCHLPWKNLSCALQAEELNGLHTFAIAFTKFYFKQLSA